MPATRYPLLATLLRRYFSSGWAFLIPYLAAYLLYYVTAWPVNPHTDTGAVASSLPLTPLTPSSSYHFIPSLLHLYWALHAVHLILAALALRSWWTSRTAVRDPNLPATRYSLLATLLPLAPWAILALIFYIPGVYLEWPSDPWEHLRRINEWRILDTVGAHSSWHKSSYFIPYSLLSWCTGLRQLFWLDFYYTGICLLLCWQYYKLARACGLGERSSMVFVIVQALLFGNNIFSFYRYYGISSSIYAQLGAIALTRIALEFAARGTNLEPSLQRGANSSTSPGTSSAHKMPSAPPSYSLLLTRYSLLTFASRPTFWHLPSLLWLLASGLCLLALTALSHIQGIGIAGLGIAAIIVWRLIEWKRAALWWMIGGTIALNAAVLWSYPIPPEIESLRAQGWLNNWYGFNILWPRSGAGDRVIEILALQGLVGTLAAIMLIKRNLAVGHLTLVPVVALLLPSVSIPLAEAITTKGNANDIIMFHRMLLSIPVGLTFISLILLHNSAARTARSWSYAASTYLCGFFLSVLLPPATRPFYNRIWNSIASTPHDLSLINLAANAASLYHPHTPAKTTITAPRIGTALLSFRPLKLMGPPSSREIGSASITAPSTALEFLEYDLGTSAPYEAKVALLRAPMSSGPSPETPSDWRSIHGQSAEFVLYHEQDGQARHAIQNRKGAPLYLFSMEMIPINRTLNYHLEARVRQLEGFGNTFLAIAWYDHSKRLLEANVPSPTGAGNPRGWKNGTYSYFGLVNEIAPKNWTAYNIAFGLGEDAKVPERAKFARIGILINYNSERECITQLSRLHLSYKQPPPIETAYAPPALLYTPSSIAGLMSNHWPAQQVCVDATGSAEIREAQRVRIDDPSQKPTKALTSATTLSVSAGDIDE